MFTRDPLKLTLKEINQQMVRRGAHPMKGVQKMSAKRVLRFKRYLDRLNKRLIEDAQRFQDEYPTTHLDAEQ